MSRNQTEILSFYHKIIHYVNTLTEMDVIAFLYYCPRDVHNSPSYFAVHSGRHPLKKDNAIAEVLQL